MFLPSNITLQFGDSGDYVAELQRRLVSSNGAGKGLVTGFYDGMTVNAVSSFQARVGIRADGIAGPETLRRLNGIVSGEEGSTTSGDNDTTNAEEEAKKNAQFTQQVFSGAEPHPLSPEALYAMPSAEPVRDAAPAEPQQAHPHQPREAAPVAPVPNADAQIIRDTAMAAQQAQTTAPSPTDILAQMLLDRTPQPVVPQPDAAARDGRPPLDQRPPLERPPLATEQPPSPLPAAQQQPLATAEAKSAEAKTEQKSEPEKPGLLRRGMQMASAAVQKLADYFEQKLPDSVLKEVQQLGVNMARAGVKEAAIPTGPEMAVERAPATPGRAEPAQAQAQSNTPLPPRG